MRIIYHTLKSAFHAALLKLGFSDNPTGELAEIFAVFHRDGVISHGLNRFMKFAKHVEEGRVDINAGPVKVHEAGAIEQWDARGGAG